MKFNYSAGLLGYGAKGTDGSAGITGYAIYFTDYDPISDKVLIKDAISNNLVLWSTAEPGTILPGGRVYYSGELFVDNRGNVHVIDLAETDKFMSYDSLKINTVTYFDTDDTRSENNFWRYYNIFDTNTNYIIDNVYSSGTINYTSAPLKIYGISPKNYARIEYTDVVDSSCNPFTVYTSGELIYTDDHKALAIVRDVTDNSFRIGNASTNIRATNLTFDVSSLRKNSTPISLNTPYGEILSNTEFGSNTLFTGVFDTSPGSFKATASDASLRFEWILTDFAPDVCIGNLYVYEKMPVGTSFNPMIFHDVSEIGDIIITDLSTNAIYNYYMKIIKDGWARNSVIKEITVNI